MSPSKFPPFLAAICCLLFSQNNTAQNCTGNLLQNPGFESGLTNWDGGGEVTTDAHSGTKALKICPDQVPPRQTFAATPGTNYTLSFWGKNGSAATQTVGYIKFLNGSYTPIADEFIYVGGTNYASFTGSKIAPAGTAWVEVSVFKTNSGTGCGFADDLCFTAGGGGGTGGNLPDLTIANLQLNGYQTQVGKVISYRFDLANQSNTSIPGNFSVKAYLSTDEFLSADDVQDGIVPTGNFAAGLSVPQVLGATTVPAGLAPGNYFIILKVDADNQIGESNEANNTVYSSSPVQVNSATGGTAGTCEKFVGNGQLVCAQPATGSTNAQFVIDGGGQRSRATFNAVPALVSTENLGAVSPQFFSEYAFEINGAVTSLVKKNQTGAVVYSKPLPAATAAVLPNFQTATEFGTGFVLMGGKNAVGNQPYIIDSIFALKTDANLNVIFKKYIGPGNGFPYGAGASSLTVVSPTRLSYIFGSALGGTSYSAWLRLMDGNFVQKSEKQLYVNIWSAGAQLRKNLCRGFTVTDSQGLGYCKSGGCYRSETFDGEFVNDQFVAYNSSIFHHQTLLGNGIENYDFFTQTTDGGSIKGERYLTGNIFQNTNDTIVLKKFNAANTLLWTKKVRVPEASFVKKIVESGGEVYFLKQNYSSDWSVLTLSCLDAPTSLPDIFTSNHFINGALNFNVGQIINPVATLRNGGAATSKADVLFRYFLSTDNLFSPDDFSTGIGYQKPNTLDYPPGYSETVSAAGIPVLASFPTGNLFLLLVSDLNNTELESNEGNNTSAVPIIINGSNPGTCATNLLQNSGFENSLANWEGTGGTISTTASAGSKSLKLCQNGSIRQTIATTAGKNLTLLFKARSETGTGKVLSYIKYLSSSWQPLVTEYFDFSTTATFASATVSKTAPAGAAFVEIGFLKQTAGCVFVDEVCLSEGGGSNPCSPDVTAPVISGCPANINFQTINDPQPNISWTPPTATDACSAVNLTSNRVPGNPFPIGSTVVTYTATDAAGNASTCSFTVTVTQVASNCVISGTVSNMQCSNNATPTNPADDTFTFDVTINKTGTCGSGWTSGTSTNGSYGVPFSVAPHLIAGGGFTFEVHDNVNFASIASVPIVPPPACSGGGGACAANLLQNGGFENNLDNWEGTNPQIFNTLPSAGAKCIRLCQNASLRQTLATSPGKNLTLLFKARTETTGANKVLSYIKYLSSSWQPLVTEFFDFSTTATYSQGTVSKTAPAGAVWVEIGFMKQTAGCVFVDEVCLSEGGAVNPLPDIFGKSCFNFIGILNGNNLGVGNVAAGGTVSFQSCSQSVINLFAPNTALTFKNKIYLSTDNAFSANDWLVSEETITTLLTAACGQNCFRSEATYPQGNIPAGIAAGAYFMISKSDADGQIAELDETNNQYVQSVTVVQSGSLLPDLTISNIVQTGPITLVGNQGVQHVPYSFNLKNNGTAAVSAPFGILGHISLDNVLSANDPSFGFLITVNSIAAGATQSLSGILQVQGTGPVGQYLILNADFQNVIPESNETNNTAVIAAPLVQTPGGGAGADLKITMTADKTTVPQWGNVTYTITAKNEGNAAISQANVLVWVCPGAQGFGFFTQANGLVFAGTPPQPTKGTLNSVSNLWEIGSLAAGQTAVLTLPAFTLTTAEKKVVAWSALQSPTDPDSQPNASIPANCTPVQDDEAVWIINAGQSGQAVSPNSSGQNPAEIADFQIFPNPTDAFCTVELARFLGKKLDITVTDIFGKTVFFEKMDELKTPTIDLDLSREMAGVYFMKIQADGHRAVVKRLIISKL